MKGNLFLLLTLLLLIPAIFLIVQKFKSSEKYKKYTANDIKNLMSNKDIFLIDTRAGAVSNLGYVKNSIIISLGEPFDYFTAVIEEGSDIVLICDENNYQESLETTEKKGDYFILGYAIYDEISKDKSLDIEVAKYNENTKESLENLVKENKYILDIREHSEKEQTGVVNEAHLIPLSTFRTDYVNIPKNEDIYIFCKGGGRSLSAMSYLKRQGYTNNIYVMKGGINQSIKEGYPLVKK